MTLVDRTAPHRARLLTAMSRVLAAKGYATLTIADVVSEAGVSKRTFYEHFATKEDCLLACYAQANDRLKEVTRAAVESVPPGPDRVAVAVDAYYAALDESGPLAIALLTEIQAIGAPGRRMRRVKIVEYAGLIRELFEEGTRLQGTPATLDPDLAIALCGGLYELAVCHAEEAPDQPFSVLGPAATRFVLGVLTVGAGLPGDAVG